MDVIESAFRSLARARGARAFHPRGIVLAGTAVVDLASGLADRAELEVVVRLSRGLGLPEPWPDFDGIAVRFVDAHGTGRHQDLLLTSAGSPPMLRRVLRPTTRFSAPHYSTVLPYRRADGRRVLLGCGPIRPAHLDAVGRSLPFPVDLGIATTGGPWRTAAVVTVRVAAEPGTDVRFDPWTTGTDLVPAGLVNRLRRGAYRGSRTGAPSGPA